MSRDWFAEWLNAAGDETLSEFVERMEARRADMAPLGAPTLVQFSEWFRPQVSGLPSAQIAALMQSAMAQQALRYQHQQAHEQLRASHYQQVMGGLLGGVGNALGRFM